MNIVREHIYIYVYTFSSRTNLHRCTGISHSGLQPRHRQTSSAHLEGRGRGSLFVVQVVAEVEQALGQVAAIRGLGGGAPRRGGDTLGRRDAGQIHRESAPARDLPAIGQWLSFHKRVGDPRLRAVRDRRVARAVVAAAVETSL
eukprot:scaffold32029_cov36-Phaeocystis_antarctica.AAC.1